MRGRGGGNFLCFTLDAHASVTFAISPPPLATPMAEHRDKVNARVPNTTFEGAAKNYVDREERKAYSRTSNEIQSGTEGNWIKVELEPLPLSSTKRMPSSWPSSNGQSHGRSGNV